MFITSTNENHFQFAQYGYYEIDLIEEFKLEPAPFMIYCIIKNRLALSIKNKDAFSDEKGYFIKFDQTKLGEITHMSRTTVAKWMKHLMDLNLIHFEQIKKGLPYKIRLVAYDYKCKRKKNTYDKKCFDLKAEVDKLSAEKVSLEEQKILLMDEINKLNKQIELKKQVNEINNNIPVAHTSTCEKIEQPTCEISLQELSTDLLTSIKTSIYPSILKDIENTIKSTVSQALNKKDGLMDKSTPVEDKPLSEQYDFVSRYYRDTMGYYDLLIDRDSTFCKIADTFFDNIMDMHFSSHIVVKGVEIGRERVRAVLARMSYFQMEDVINEYKNLTVKVKDHNTYIKSMIYNSILSFEAKSHNDYKHGEAEYYKKLAEQSQPQQPQHKDDIWAQLEASGF